MSVPIDGAALRRELAIRGLTQADLAIESHRTQATICHAASGRRVSPSTLAAIARVLARNPPLVGAEAICPPVRGNRTPAH